MPGDGERRTTKVRLDAGKGAGLLPGLELRSLGPRTYIRARVEDVLDSSSTAVIVEAYVGDEPPPEVGRELSSRALTRSEPCTEEEDVERDDGE